MSEPLRYPRPPLLAGFGARHAVVESSAGTGKTFLLEHMVVDLVLRLAVPLDEILVLTFTDKAAGELVSRIRALIDGLAHLRADDPRAIAARDMNDEESWRIDDDARLRLTAALASFDRASISTIHGFCQRVLREHAFAQGRLFDEELVAEEAMFQAALREVLRTQVVADERLGRALEAYLAQGGSVKKLETLLVGCHNKGAELARVPFDEARLTGAARASAQALSDLEIVKRALDGAKVNRGSVKALVRRLGALQDRLRAAAENIFTLPTGEGALTTDEDLKEALQFILDRIPQNADDPTLVALSRALAELRASVVPLDALLVHMLLPVVRERAAERKRRGGLYDFADMLRLVERALAADTGASRELDEGPHGGPSNPPRSRAAGQSLPAPTRLLAALRSRYRHALIDEFQDTDPVQWSIFRRIFVDGAPAGHTLTLIGDPKQSIYAFRGADVHTYLDATRTLRESGGARLCLETNYRSTADVVALVNRVFDQKDGFFRAGSGIKYDQPVTCGRTDLAFVDEAGNAQTPLVVFDLVAKHTPRAYELRATLEHAIVAELRALLAPTASVRVHDKSEQRPLRARDVFVLTFSNAESRAVGRALARAGLRYTFYKIGNLFESLEANEVLAILRAIADPDDANLRAQALLTEFFALDLVEVSACMATGPAAPQVDRLLSLSALAHSGDIPALFAALTDQTGIARRQLFANAGERALTNTQHVLEILQAEWSKTHATVAELADFLHALIHGTRTLPSHEGDLQRLETDEDAVQILTVHKAKGLEAGVVFVYGGTGRRPDSRMQVVHEEGRRVVHAGKPSADVRQRAAEEQADEDSRLLYVAMTRARCRLYLPCYPTSWKRLSGCYVQANARLRALLGDAFDRFQSLATVVPCTVGETQAAGPEAAAATTLVVPPDLSLAPVAPPADLDAIKSARNGFRMTSYSAVKRARDGLAKSIDSSHASRHDEFRAAGAEAQAGGKDGDKDSLPGGAEVGIFLHDLLATAALRELAELPDFEAWVTRPEVSAWLARACRRHGQPPSHAAPAARLIHTAYTAPTRLGRGQATVLAQVEPCLREMEFLFPMPEAAHRLLAQPLFRPRWTIGRGVVRGFVDFLFEAGGKVFICDWKSDTLPSYAPAALAAHCRDSYDVQAILYTMATLRMLGIADARDYETRMGGLVFCFLRARRPGDERAGIHFQRPSWDELLGYESDMLGTRFWGGGT